MKQGPAWDEIDPPIHNPQKTAANLFLMLLLLLLLLLLLPLSLGVCVTCAT